jgi:ABC-type polysaccharide/polyol phosphate export permease
MVSKKDIVLFYSKAKLESDIVENYMGFLWWVLDPIMSALVYYIVFDLLLHRGRQDYIQFLFIGIVAWKWFATSIKSGGSSISNQKSLIKKVYLPKIVFPWIETNFTTVKFLFAIILITVSFPLFGYKITLNHLYLPPLIFSQFAFILGCSTFLSALTPFFPDFNIIVNHLLRLAFYPSGILFAVDRVPQQFKFLMQYNPMAQVVHSYRDIIMYGNPPTAITMPLLLTTGIIFYVIGAGLIKKFEGRYAKLF